MRATLVAALALAFVLTTPAASQQVESQPVERAGSSTIRAAPDGLLASVDAWFLPDSSAVVVRPPVTIHALTTAGEGRPGWALPVAGAVIGGLLGALSQQDCHECMVSIPAPLTGALYGLTAGILIELILPNE
ncbi:MAG TPA: hypothetical protein VGB24_10680 [Longimicrobium sp.]|jgi:hypothetical protein|uniref:hypothetical protein n=1 Tax=Longimicrobium sp. TaxID=2029185 RepID=UPI002ED97435